MEIPVTFAGLGYALAISALAAGLLVVKKMDGRIHFLLLAASLAIPGLLLGGAPNPVAPLQQIMYGLTHSSLNLAWIAGLAVLLTTSLLAGRLFCGYVCPLGAVQEIIARLNPRQYRVDTRISRAIRLAVLIGFIAIGTLVVVYPKIDPFGVFSLHPTLVQAGIMATILLAAVFVYRPWCTLLCPFGALSGLAATLGPLKLRAGAACNHCGLCTKRCPTGQIRQDTGMGECYYCGRCINACRKKAIEISLPSSIRKNHHIRSMDEREIVIDSASQPIEE